MSLKGEIVFFNSNLKKFTLFDLVLLSVKVVNKVGIYEALVFLMSSVPYVTMSFWIKGSFIHTSVTNLTEAGNVEQRLVLRHGCSQTRQQCR